MMFRFRLMILISLGLIATACSAPFPDEPAPDVLTQIAQLTPTEPPATPTAIPPTATALPPTSTFTVEPTVTATVTPEPTATATATLTRTPVPTLAPTQPVATKASVAATVPPTKASAAAPAPVSAIPANAPLNAAVQRTFQTAQGILGELNNVLAGRGSQCDTLMAMYGLFVTAPVYDISQQPADTQTAYGLYREGVDAINATAPKVRRICEGQGGGNIDKLELGVAQKSAGQAVNLLGRASGLLPAVAATLPAPVAAATTAPAISSIALSDLLLQTMERMHTAGGHLDGAQTDLNAGFCDQFKPLYHTIITVVALKEAGRDPLWIDSYGAYKVAIGYFQNKLYRAVEVCAAGGGTIGKSEFGEMRRAVDAAAIAVARAYDRLRIANLLGQ